jgi:phosphoribosyl-ATP pyrophosphohydrolase
VQESGKTLDESATTLGRLVAVIRDRKFHPPERSYTTTLFQGGVERIGAKITEEAAELVEAAAEPDEPGRQHVIHESADLVYHLLVLLRYRDVEWSEVEAELGRRLGISGLDEKESRSG